jgi:hypothetical protein
MMFSGKSRSRLPGILLAAVLVLLTGAVTAQGLPGSRYPISAADIAKELAVVGINMQTSQVHIPAGMSAAGISPNLEIVTAEPIGHDQVRLELRCATVGECLPFFAILDVEKAKLVSAELQLKSQGAAAGHQTATQVIASRSSQPQVRGGSRVVMIIQDDHMDIHLHVLAIDTGAMGQQVRVSTFDRKKIFHATVTGEGTVTGVIE